MVLAPIPLLLDHTNGGQCPPYGGYDLYQFAQISNSSVYALQLSALRRDFAKVG
jgi:hypothetical protein